MIHHFIELVLPEIISAIELVGVILVIIGCASAVVYLLKSVKNRKNYHVKVRLGQYLSLGLEFKMAAEILKTLLIEDISDIYLLGAIVLIRVVLGLVIHFEVEAERKECTKEELEQIDIE